MKKTTQPKSKKLQPTPWITEPETPCCEKPTPLIPIVIIAALFILAVVLGAILFQQEKIATQRQQLQACTNHIAGLQDALQDAKAARCTAFEERDWAVASMKSKCSARRIGPNTIEWRSGYYCWWETVELPVGFTNHMEYPPRFLLKD